MLVRSMSRKEASFAQLIAYVSREVSDGDFAIHHNVLARIQSDLVDEFNDNAKLLRKRKNGTVMFHEIVSIKRPKGLSDSAQKMALRDIAEHYIAARAPHNLVYGGLHDDHKGHLHYHLVISSNPLGIARRHWLTKKKFRAIAIGLEQRVLKTYPELEQTVAINKTAAIKISSKEQAVKVRTRKASNNELLANDLSKVFQQSKSLKDLRTALKERQFNLYQRGKAIGVIKTDTGRKHRLTTLGIMNDYEAMKQRLQVLARKPGKLARQLPKDDQKAKPVLTELRPQDQTMREREMDIFGVLQIGSGFLDVLSMTQDPTALSTKDKEEISKRAASNEALKEKILKTKKKKTDLQIITEARKAEMKKIRQQKQKSKRKAKSNVRLS